MESNITPFDLHRMFFGDLPPLFYLEIIVRVFIIYTYSLLLIRWVGGRGVAQLSLVEFLLVIALGSAVGDVMFYPEVPLLIALFVVTLIIVLNKIMDKFILVSKTAKRVIDGGPVALVRNGTLIMDGLRRLDFGVNEVKAMLRQAGVSNLGQVSHAYLEISGGLSVYQRPTAVPGLAIVPPPDVFPPEGLPGEPGEADGTVCCADCGNGADAASVLSDVPCGNCGNRVWVKARLPGADDTPVEQ